MRSLPLRLLLLWLLCWHSLWLQVLLLYRADHMSSIYFNAHWFTHGCASKQQPTLVLVLSKVLLVLLARLPLV
jgi:hypothetical protein